MEKQTCKIKLLNTQYTTDRVTICYYLITHSTLHLTSKLTTQPLPKMSEPKEVDCCT